MSPPGVHVRRLSSDDLGGVREVNRLFGRAFEDEARYAGASPSDPYLSRLLASEMLTVLAAWDDAGEIVGALTAYELPKFEQETSEIYIYDLAVAEARRRQGVATALIAGLQSIAAERNAWVIFVQADPEDEPAIALYTRLGTREDVHHFDIPVRL